MSIDGSGKQQANGPSGGPSISADGNVVAFDSGARDLVPADINREFDVFVRDRGARTTRRVSVDSRERQASGLSFQPSVSADGNIIAFSSNADLAEQGTRTLGVFVRERPAGVTMPVSVDGRGRQVNDPSSNPSVSADGKWVAFDSEAADLVPRDTNGSEDIFLRDRVVRATTRVSVGSRGQQASDESSHASLSADGNGRCL